MQEADTLTPLSGWVLEGTPGDTLADCSLIIATYCRHSEVMALVELLRSQNGVPAEVIIVDGERESSLGPKLGQRWQAGSLPFRLMYVQSEPGLTRQRNVGIDVSQGETVFFLDDDSIPLDGYFTAIRNCFAGDAEIGAIGGLVLNELNRPMVRRWRLRFAFGLVPSAEPMTYLPCGTSVPRGLMQAFRGVRRVDVLPGCAFAFRREALNRHRFSEFFYSYSQGEDLEMSLRVGQDWKVVCCGDARMTHHPAPGGRPPSFRKGVMEVWNRYFIWKRFIKAPSWIDRIRFWADVGLLIGMDLTWFLARPFRLSPLRHGAGLAWAAIRCLVSPPAYSEPSAPRRFILQTGLTDSTQVTRVA